MNFNLIFGDCIDEIKKLQDNSIDMILTSPPYDNLRDYDGQECCLSFEKFQKICKEIYRVIKNGGVVVWIVGDATINGSETGTSFRQALYFMEIGFKLHDTMIWNKKSSPYQHKCRYINTFEYMFIFSKGRPKAANIICDRKNARAGEKIHSTQRERDGRLHKKSGAIRGRVIKEFGQRINVWDISRECFNKTGHPAVFPVRLAEDHIRTWSNEGDTIMDPFMGSGTTGIATLNLNRNFVGIEISKKYFDIASERIETERPKLPANG